MFKHEFDPDPVWPDTISTTNNRSIMYNFYNNMGDIQYLLRCTNSKKNPSHIFHILDRMLARDIVAPLALMHRSIENEFRAIRIFIDVKHEFKQKLVGIQSASNYVRKTIVRKMNAEPKINEENVFKLTHIKNTISDIVKMLDRFTFPLPSLQDTDDEIKPFKPYADLVRPICEKYHDAAKQKGQKFSYYGEHQLGLLYANMSEWSHIVENLINNMVKYSYDNQTLQIAFERRREGGGIIHFASNSIPITEEEKELIFKFTYRTKKAIEKTKDGEGIGLCYAKYIANSHGGQILLRSENDINIFSLVLPQHLFRDPRNK
jgi:light-regulated signal transduction histidine kinase (bacteriophytochrome)